MGERTALAPPRPSVPAARNSIRSQSSFACPYALSGPSPGPPSATSAALGRPYASTLLTKTNVPVRQESTRARMAATSTSGRVNVHAAWITPDTPSAAARRLSRSDRSPSTTSSPSPVT